MQSTRTNFYILFIFFSLSCNRHPDSKEYFFISSTSGLVRENELIVNMDSVFVHRFILRAPYAHYDKLFNDSLSLEHTAGKGNKSPFLMFRYAVMDSAKEDIAISDMNLQVYKLYDSIPGDEIPIHGVCTGHLRAPAEKAEIVGKSFSPKDTIKIKGGNGQPVIFMTAYYDLKDHLEDATFLLHTQLTIKYKNAYNMVEMYDTIVQHERY